MSTERLSETDRRQHGPQRRATNGRACVHCHYRKVRCDVSDKGVPCSNCRSHGQPNCQVYQKKKTRSARARAANPPIAPKEPAATTTTTTATTTTTHDEEQQEAGNLVDLVYRQDLRHGEVGPLGRMCFIGSAVSNFSHIVRQVAPPELSRGAFHFGSRQFQRRHTSHELQRVPREALARSPPSLETRLLRAYFDHVNAGWPVVDEVHFMAQYRGSQDAPPLPLPLLNAVLLVGAHVLAARGERDVVPLQRTFFRRAKALVDCRYEQDRTMYVQVALLLTWYSDGQEEIVANAWHWVGFAVRVAIGHGMHRDATHSRMLPVHRRLWTRLWWILYQFDTAVSAAYGRPQMLNLNESDVPELEPAHFEGIPNAQVDFAMQHAKLCALFSEAMRTRWALRSSPEARIAATRRADAQLAAFLTSLPPSLRLSMARLTPWTATLHLTYNNFALLLHRPPPLAADADVVSAACADPALCGAAAASMAQIFEALCAGDDPSGLWLYGVHAAFTALIHVSGELAAATGPLAAARTQGTFDALMDALGCLARHWGFAGNLLRLFRRRAALLRDGGAEAAAATAARPDATTEGFSLRPPPPPPLAPPAEAVVPWENVPAGHVRFDNDDAADGGAEEAPQQHDDDLRAGELMMGDYSDSFALELFLAGMDGSTQDVLG